jgi:hypothetical protein
MLGRFLEFSVAVPDIAASVLFYERLGFVQLACIDPWPHAYCALTDGHCCIGLHARAAPAHTLSFVKPHLARSGAMPRLQCYESHLGDDVFHHLRCRGPGGQDITLLEARTFSPAAARPPAPHSGSFFAYGLPVSDPASAAAEWERAGLVAFESASAPYLHTPVTGDGLNLALHDARWLPGAALVATHAQLPALRTWAQDAGLRPTTPPGIATDGLMLRAPEGTAVLIIAEER